MLSCCNTFHSFRLYLANRICSKRLLSATADQLGTFQHGHNPTECALNMSFALVSTKRGLSSLESEDRWIFTNSVKHEAFRVEGIKTGNYDKHQVYKPHGTVQRFVFWTVKVRKVFFLTDFSFWSKVLFGLESAQTTLDLYLCIY